ncbi:ArsR/SmtB family transcription factor [Tabrizicola caldifontis]|uniref:ArsR/SmtB family transcription factor n=1 Tax=Tabrizicola caldifontis TaxID=2528036 RepID=UPI001080F10E|nr:metalloregulator ArsR/SmtB family transcription factor [Rhodobacter sp. YIM 73028]
MSLDRSARETDAALELLAAGLRDAQIEGSIAVRISKAAAFLKALSHEGRLMILCHLASGERSVTELEQLLGARPAAVSQQLARLRLEGLVTTRRDGKTIYYSIQDPKVLAQIRLLRNLFSAED